MTIILGFVGFLVIGVMVSSVYQYRVIRANQRKIMNRTINNSFPVGIKPTYYSID